MLTVYYLSEVWARDFASRGGFVDPYGAADVDVAALAVLPEQNVLDALVLFYSRKNLDCVCLAWPELCGHHHVSAEPGSYQSACESYVAAAEYADGMSCPAV